MTAPLLDLNGCLAGFPDQGFALVPSAFAFDEIAWVRDEARVVALRRSKAGQARGTEPWAYEAPEGTVYGTHLAEAAFRKLASHPRLVTAARQLLGEDVYIHQSRLVPRFADRPSDVLWRRDFATWSVIDGMAAPRAVTAAVVLGDGTEAPVLHVAPGSHRRPAAAEPPLVLSAPLGSVLFYHGDLAYAFNQPGDGRSPSLYLVTYNALGNRIAGGGRDALYAAREAASIQVEPDDCLWPTPWFAAG